MTYLLMSLPFVAVAIVVFVAAALHARRRRAVRRYLASWGATTIALLVLTAVFDNVMIAAGFFDYGTEHVSGIRLGLVPAEDFLYPLAGALLLAGVWQLLGANEPAGRREEQFDG